MALRLTEKSDIKIFILYLLSRVDRPLDFITLHDICVQDEFINTFDFMDEFYELQKIKAITVEKNDDGSEKVRITHKGRDTAQTMKDTILPEILDHAVRSALQLISFQTRGLKPRASIEEATGGRYNFICSVSGEDGVFMETKLFEMTIPAKLQSYMACGMPVIAAAAGETQRIIDEAKCGVYSPSGDAEALAKSIEKMMGCTREEKDIMKCNSRTYFLEHFEKQKLMIQMDRYFDESTIN